MKLTKERKALKITYIFLASIGYLGFLIPIVFNKFDISLLGLLLVGLIFTLLASRVGKPKNNIVKPKRRL